jgi:hypothetical protein
MSAKNVNSFFEKVAVSKPLQAKLNALHKKIMKDSKEESAAEIVKIASAEGFEFTAKDWNQERKARVKRASKAEAAGVTGQIYCEGTVYDTCASNHTCFRAAWY